MNEDTTQRDKTKVAAFRSDGYGRLLAVGTLVLWLATMLLLLGPSAARGLF